MKISVIQVPYDTALYDTRMGRGPGRFLKEGAIERLEALGHQVSLSTVDPRPSFPAEVETSFELMRLLADEVRSASESGAFPLVLAGNCNMSVGIVSGLAPRRAGVVWFDGHADFETPESTGSGFIDGMGLAIITGHCWQPLARLISGYTPVPEERVILAGAREIDPYESDRLVSSNITYLSDRDLKADDAGHHFDKALDHLATEVDGIYLHIDLDVHDACVAPANHFRPPGGLTPEELRYAVELVTTRITVLAASITAYDPDVDPEGVTLRSGLALMETIAAKNQLSITMRHG